MNNILKALLLWILSFLIIALVAHTFWFEYRLVNLEIMVFKNIENVNKIALIQSNFINKLIIHTNSL